MASDDEPGNCAEPQGQGKYEQAQGVELDEKDGEERCDQHDCQRLPNHAGIKAVDHERGMPSASVK